MKEITYDDVINRIGYFRNEQKLSQRAVSDMLDQNKQFMYTIENKTVQLKVKTLLNFCDIVGISIYDFFYLGKDFNQNDKNILELYGSLSAEDKQMVVELMKKLGKK